MKDIVQGNINTITTLEIAKIMEIPHAKLLRKLEGSNDRKGYVEILVEHDLVLTDYFIKSSYKTSQNQTMPCYLVTKKGCDYLATSFTGEKGNLFRAKYIERFGGQYESVAVMLDRDSSSNDRYNILTITTLEIAEMMEVEHKSILRKLDGDSKSKGYIKILGEHNFVLTDYFIKSNYKTSQNKTMPCYLVTKLGCDFLANKFTGEKGVLFTAKYVKRFDEMEQQIKNSFKLPITYKEALIQLLEQVEKNEKLEEERKILLPKSDYHDKVLNKDGLITTTVIAKDLGVKSAAKLNHIMNLNHVIFKNKSGTWCPYADYEWLITEGYADYQSYKEEKSKLCLKWTEKGRKWIIENYDKWIGNCTKQLE